VRHFIVYHNPEKMGPLEPKDVELSIVTGKSVNGLLGDRIWLLMGEGRPRRVYLCATFIVDSVYPDEEEEPYPNLASGTEGVVFNPFVSLNNCPWFEEFKAKQGNFAFGLQAVKERRFINGLVAAGALTSAQVPKTDKVMRRKVGGGFGDLVSNKEVELAAIKAVRDYYKGRGWSVISVENECLGYDLDCTKGKQLQHVEVKGIRGSLCSFIITPNELDASRGDPLFRLCAVTNATDTPKFHWFSGERLLLDFRFEPASFYARPKEGQSNHAA
jgi:hypothetical protein